MVNMYGKNLSDLSKVHWLEILLTAAALTPCFFKAIHGFSPGIELFRSAWCLRSSLFFQLQNQRQTGLRRRLKEFNRCGPLDGAVIGREVLVLFGMIVVQMHGRNEFAQRRETLFNALFFGAVTEMRVANIKI